MADLKLNHAETAATTLDDQWRQLAPIIDEASRVKDEATRDPSLANDPWVVAHLRWLTLFERELAAVQTVHESSENGASLPAEDLRTTSDVAERLLDAISEARNRIHHAQPA